MALVRDPLTGQMYDDGRPAPVAGATPTQQAGAVRAADMANRASLAALTAPRTTELPMNRAAATVDPLAQAGAIRLNDAALNAARQPALGAPPVAVNRADANPDPLAQAGAIRATDTANRAIGQAGAPVNAPLRPQTGAVGPAPQARSLLEPGTAFANAVGGALGVNFQPGLPYGQRGAPQTTAQRPALADTLSTATRAVMESPLGIPARALGTVAAPVARVGLSALALPVAAGVEGVRNAAVSALGGDVSSLPGGGTATSDAASAMLQRGVDQLGDLANRAGTSAQDFALGLLGAQRTQPATATLDTSAVANNQTFAPGTVGAGGVTPADQAVLAEDRANLRAAVDALNQNFDTWRVPEPSARPVTGGGAGGAVLSADQQPQRGNYTQTNTDLDALRQRSAGGNGIDFGFGEGGARGYLDRMAAQDAAEAAARRQRGADARAELQRDQLTRQMAAGDPFERRAARERLVIESGLTQQDMGGRTELERTRLAGQYGLQDATLRGEYGLQGTQLQGEYGLLDRELANAGQVEAARQQGLAGLAAAEARAAGTVQAAQLRSQGNAGTDALRQQEALAAQIRNAQMLDALSRNDMQAYQQMQFGRFAPQAQTFVDPMTGAPLSPEQIAALQAASLSRLNP